MTVLDFFESLDEFDIDDYEEPEGDYSEEIEDCESPQQVFRCGWTSAIGSVRDSVGKIQDVAREAAGQLKTANEEIESLKSGIEQNSIIAIVYRVESHEQYEQDYSEFGYPIYADDIKQDNGIKLRNFSL